MTFSSCNTTLNVEYVGRYATETTCRTWVCWGVAQMFHCGRFSRVINNTLLIQMTLLDTLGNFEELQLNLGKGLLLFMDLSIIPQFSNLVKIQDKIRQEKFI